MAHSNNILEQSYKNGRINFSCDKKRNNLIFSFFFILFLSINVFGQNATEDFNPTGNVFGGGVSGTGWVNNSWVRSGGNGNTGDVQAINPTDGDDNIGGNLLQLDDNDAGAYRIIDFSAVTAATLTFDYDYDNTMDGGETLLIQIDPENDGTYVTIRTITATTNSPNPEVNLSIIIPPGTLGGANTRIRFITGADNGINGNGEDWWIDNISISPPDQPPVVTATGNEYLCPGVGNSQNIATSISITDPDDTTADAVYIQISSGYVNGEDVLTLSSPGSHPSITASFDATQGELTLQGPATFAEFEAAVLDVLYSSSNSGATGTRQFSITPGTANYLPSTDHYYEFVPFLGITWTAANTAANGRTYFGLQGYLATLTSQAEADFSGSQATGVGWIGANDVATEGDWRWVTGPEGLANAGTGTPFWSGGVGGTTVPPTNFAFWNSGEPNNCCGGEDYAHITDLSVTTMPGSWNDLSNTGAGSGPYQPQGYVVEYGGTPGDPVLSISATTTINLTTISITAQPVDDSICSGDNSSFSVSANGPGQTLTYQWQVSTGGPYSDLSNGGIYSNVTTSTLNITGATTGENTNQYRVIVTSDVPGCGPLTSTAGVLTVVATPDVDDLADVIACDTYTLPAITGTNLTGGESYYTATGGGGTAIAAGTAITTTTTLFIYDETGTTPNCFDEEDSYDHYQ